ncbi:tripartite tricarboxylate transporter substrate binding protein [Ruania alba]|uniref:Tripartite-type tricarboxylate transporter, receptor component TctC n=1 Tax=Ruania alba TaxID=648782 RepID=A0A1H5M8U3_9MICO|nr:tripartite tricarboxylate transporter substrate binding protein [Ruania alba]SEE85919.1 Tripartite-type tricarboxylate transporter, receptor component TctC [Ruania alba]
MQRRTFAAASLLLAGTLLTACTDASGSGNGSEDYPSDQITMIVPFPAGSAPDSTARTLASVMETELGQRIVIENKEGGSGTIGLSELAAAEPDGYTISWFASPGVTMQWQRIDTPFEGPEAITPVAQAISVGTVMFAASDSGLTTIEDIVAAAEAAPGEISVALPGEGSGMDLAVRELEAVAEIEFDRIYVGAGEQIQPVVNGTYDLGAAQAPPVVQYVERGDLSWIGVFGDAVPAGIDAPLVADSEYEIDPTAVAGYEGIVAPAGTPEEIVDALAAAVETAVASEEFSEYISSTHGIAQFTGPDELAQKIDDGTATATELIERYGL